jgi:23S rRNA (cytosine1962-C5)-methyltransferase
MRLYSRSKEGADKGFFKRRIREALTRRLMNADAEAGSYNPLRESARMVFAEADFLPGFMADRFVGWPLGAVEEKTADRPLIYEDVEDAMGPPLSWLSLQFLSWGMDARREEILDALEETLSAPLSPEAGRALGAPSGIVERSPARVRELEGLPPREGLVRGSFPPEGIVIFENGLPFLVHLEEGQKTGHFLDQRDNRLRTAALAGLASLAGGGAAASRVLDACCYTGGFGIHALRLGGYGPGGGFSGTGRGEESLRVCFVDSSAAALETVRKNAALNGVEGMIETLEADVFEYLRQCERQKERFGLIILDPPAFAKSRSSLEGALRGYHEINLRAMKLLSPGGVLVSCSCSQALDQGAFRRVIARASADAERRLLEIDFRCQAADHPVLVGYDESLYLKCGYYRALD